jgi:hypothetical protein
MTFSRSQIRTPLGILYVLTGETTSEELIGISNELREDKNIVFAILDFTYASPESLTLSDLHQIAIRDTSFPDTHSFEKLALVGLTGPGLWLAETYRLFTEKWILKRHDYETGIFDKIDQATDWIGISHLNQELGP